MNFININGIEWNANIVTEVKNIELTALGYLLTDFLVTDKIQFSSNVWDFSDRNKHNRQRSRYIFNFTNINNRYSVYLKKMIITSLMIKENTMTTVYQSYNYNKRFIRYLEENLIWHAELINTDLLKSFLGKVLENKTYRFRESLCIAIEKLLMEIESNHSAIDYSREYKYLESLRDYKQIALERETGKTNYIPFRLLNKIVSLAIQAIKNESLSIDKRMMACMIVILAETGMRVEELTLIERGKLVRFSTKEGKKTAYLKFKTFKGTKGIKEFESTITYLSDKAEMAYEKLEEFADNVIDNLDEKAKMRLLLFHAGEKNYNYETKKQELKSLLSKININEMNELESKSRQYLYIDYRTGKPFLDSTAAFRRSMVRLFFVYHQDKLDFDKLSQADIDLLNRLDIDSENKVKTFISGSKYIDCSKYFGKKFYYVNPHMFRVTVCTKLFQQGVHIDFIRKHMNHLTEDMTNYYNRSAEFRDSLVEGIKIVSSIANSKGLIETNGEFIKNEAIKKELANPSTRADYEKINEFLEKNKLNIVRDVDKLIKMIEKSNSPIFESELGVCTKSAIHGICQRQKYFSSVSDFYHIGVKIPSLKLMHFSYNRFLEKEKIVKYNEKVARKNPKYALEFDREKKALKFYLEKTLLPELQLAKKEINEMGVDAFICLYPDLKDIAPKVDYILNSEVSTWTK